LIEFESSVDVLVVANQSLFFHRGVGRGAGVGRDLGDGVVL
jgi:hypothetical protein